jgi:hypothetical protein
LSAQVKQSVQTLGGFPSAIAILISAYIVGYLVSTITLISWEFWANKSPTMRIVLWPGLSDALKDTFGDIMEKRGNESDISHSNRIVDCCLGFIETKEPEFFATNIERKLSMKNFEIGMPGALVVWSGSLLTALAFPVSLLPAVLALGLAPTFTSEEAVLSIDRSMNERLQHSFTSSGIKVSLRATVCPCRLTTVDSKCSVKGGEKLLNLEYQEVPDFVTDTILNK